MYHIITCKYNKFLNAKNCFIILKNYRVILMLGFYLESLYLFFCTKKIQAWLSIMLTLQNAAKRKVSLEWRGMGQSLLGVDVKVRQSGLEGEEQKPV